MSLDSSDSPVAAESVASDLAPLAACTRTGERVRVDGDLVIDNGGRIELGDDVRLDARLSPIVLRTASGATLTVGSGTSAEFGVRLEATHAIRVGDRVSLGPHVLISDAGDDRGAGAPIEVGDGAVLGAGVQVLAGAMIPAGAEVHAGTVVRGAPRPKTAVSSTVSLPRYRGIVLADFTASELVAALQTADDAPLALDVSEAPLSQVVQTLHALVQGEDRPDAAVVWTRPEDTIRGFRALASGERVALPAILDEVDAFAAQIRAHAAAARFVFVASWARTPEQRGLGMLDLQSGGLTATLLRMNLRLAEQLAEVPNVFVLDAQRWVAAGGLASVRPKRWFLGKVPYGPEVFSEAARDIRAALAGVLGMTKKLLVVDLDDTMWGGIVGDVGWEGLRLGGHDAAGEAFVEFQHRLLALSKRGVALAVVSKNEEQTALTAMRSHPEMVIRPEHLAAYRINWRDKAQNVVEIARELNLGLQSVVFLDDNPVERGRVRDALPEVLVPEWPADPTSYPLALDSLRCFDTPRVSDEDVARNAMYAVERERTAQQTQFESLDSWLASLGTHVRLERLSAANLARCTQLLNKTNQMNLRTRRLSEAELAAWAETPGHELWAAHVSDKFGASGLTGLLGLRVDGDTAHVEDYVLSCRVMGRRVEETLVWVATERARALGATTLVVEPLPTSKNMPCLRFWEGTPFERSADGSTYTWNVTESFPAPSVVQVDGVS